MKVDIEPMEISDQMAVSDIIKEYNTAAEKEQAVRILSERNGVDSFVIRAIVSGKLDALPPPSERITIDTKGLRPTEYALGVATLWEKLYYERGFSAAEIETLYGVPRGSVLSYLRKMKRRKKIEGG